MSDITNNIRMVDNIFSDYLMKKVNNSTLEKKLSTILTNTKFNNTDRNFEVSVTNMKYKEPFFGMRIFPVISDLDVLASSITNEKLSYKELCGKWKKIKNWYIEIDAQVFDRTSINLNPKELTSLLLHEIGHTIFSDTVLEVFYRAYKESYMRMKVTDKASLKFLYILYMVPLTIPCMARHYINEKNEINVEYYADKVLTDMEYKEYLISAINKIIKAYGNSFNTSDVDAKVNSSIKWCNMNTIDLIKRKNKLKDDLFLMGIKSESNYIKAMTLKIINFLGIKMRENYTGAVVESITEVLENKDFANYTSYYDIKTISRIEKAIESTLNRDPMTIAMEAKNKVKSLPSQYDLDAIAVECDRIENHHDRIYVLDLIYNKIEEIESFKSLMEYDSSLMRRYKDKADRMLDQLESMRQLVLSKRKFSSDYKLFVKYPSGYEG